MLRQSVNDPPFFFSLSFSFFLLKMYLLQVRTEKVRDSAAAVPKKVTRSELKVLSSVESIFSQKVTQVVKEQGCPSYEVFLGFGTPTS